MADSLKLLLSAMLNPNSKKNIEEEIKNLQTLFDKSPLKVKLDIDNSQFKAFSENLNKISANINKSLSINPESSGLDKIGKVVNVTKDGTESVTKRTKEWVNELGEVVKQVQKIESTFDEVKNEVVETPKSTTLSYLNDIKQKQLEAQKEAQRQFNLGTNLTDKTSGFTGVDKDSVARYAKEIYGANASVIGFNQSMDKNNKIMSEAIIRVDKNRQEYQAYKLKVDQATQSVNQFGEATSRKTGKDQGIFEKMKTAFEVYPIWLSTTTVVMQTIHSIQDGIKYIYDMDSALTDLSKVVDFSKNELLQMSNAAIILGKELGKSSVDIMKGMAEFGRITKNKDEIIELTRVATMASNVTEMTAQSAAKSITSTMVTFGLQAKDSMKILDSWNQLQNNFRVSAEDLADAISKIGAASKVAKTDMQQVEGVITSIIQSTGITGSEAGTALKAFMSRIYKTDESDVEELGKTSKMLQNITKVSTESADGIKPFGKLLDEIAIKWTTLGEKQKIALAQQIGGTYHYSKFIALMDNYKIAQNATTMAYNSQNSAIDENEKKINSIEGKLGKLTVTFENIWKNAISSDSIKTLLDFGNGILGVVDKIGILPTAIMTVSTALLLFKNEAIIGAITGLVSFNTSLVTTTAELGVVGSSIVGVTFATNALKAAMLTNPLGILALGITAATVAFTAFNNVQEKALEEEKKRKQEQVNIIENIDKQISSLKGQEQSLTELLGTYNALSSKVNLSDEEHKNLLETQNKIANMFPNLIDGYDAEGNAHIKNATAINEEIKKNKELQATKEASKRDYYVDKLKEEQKNIQSLSSTIKTWEDSIEETKNRKVDSNGNYKNIAGENVNRDDAIKQTREGIVKFKTELENSQKSVQDLVLNIQKGIPEFSSLNGITEKIANNLSTNLTKSFTDGKISVDNYVESYSKIIRSIQSNNLQKQYDDYSKLEKKYKDGEISLYTLNSAYEKLNKSLLDVGVSANNTKMFLQAPTESFNQGINEFNKQLEKLSSSFDDITEKIRSYKDILDDLNNKNGISDSTYKDIIKNHKDLIPYLGDEIELRKRITKAISDEETIQRTAYIQMLQSSEDFYNTKILANTQLIEEIRKDYNIDLNNYKNLAQAKEEIETQLISSISAKWGSFYDVQSDAFTQNWQSFRNTVPQDVVDKVQGLINNDVNKLKAVKKRFDDITLQSSNINFNKINVGSVSKNKSGKESGFSTSTEVDANEALLAKDRYFDLNQEKAKYENQINLNKAQQENADFEKKLKLLSDIRDMYKSLQNVVHNTADEYRNEAKEIENTLTTDSKYKNLGFQFSGVGDERKISNYSEVINKLTDEVNSYRMDKDKTVYKNLKELLSDAQNQAKRFLDIQTSEIPKARQEWANLEKEINGIDLNKLENIDKKAKEIADSAKKMTEAFKPYIDELEKLMKEEEKVHKQKIDNIEEEKKAFDDLVEDKLDKLEKEKDAQDYNKDIGKLNQELSDLQNEKAKYSMAATGNNGDSEAIAKVKELDEKIKEKQEAIADKQSDREFKLRKENLQDIKKTEDERFEKEKDTENKRYDAIKDTYDKAKTDMEEFVHSGINANQQMVDTIISDYNNLSTQFSATTKVMAQTLQTTFISKLQETLRQLLALQNQMEKITGGKTLSDDGKTVADYQKEYNDARQRAINGDPNAWQDMRDANAGANKIRLGESKVTAVQDIENAKEGKLKAFAGGTDDVKELSFVGEHGRELRALNPNGKDSIIPNGLTERLVSMASNPLSFVQNLLPKFNSTMPQIVPAGMNGFSMGDININVAGSLDKTVVPTIKQNFESSLKNELNKLGVFRK